MNGGTSCTVSSMQVQNFNDLSISSFYHKAKQFMIDLWH